MVWMTKSSSASRDFALRDNIEPAQDLTFVCLLAALDSGDVLEMAADGLIGGVGGRPIWWKPESFKSTGELGPSAPLIGRSESDRAARGG